MKYAYIFTALVLIMCLYRSCTGVANSEENRKGSLRKRKELKGKNIGALVEPILEEENISELNRSTDEFILELDAVLNMYEESKK